VFIQRLLHAEREGSLVGLPPRQKEEGLEAGFSFVGLPQRQKEGLEAGSST